MDSKFVEELRQKYIKNPPEGMTAALVKNMTDSDLLDMHYFLTEDARLRLAILIQDSSGRRNFLLYKKTSFYWDAFSCKLVCCYKKYHSVLFGTIQNKNCCQQTLKVIKYPVNMRFSGSILLYYAQDKPASGRRLCSVWESDRRYGSGESDR